MIKKMFPIFSKFTPKKLKNYLFNVVTNGKFTFTTETNPKNLLFIPVLF